MTFPRKPFRIEDDPENLDGFDECPMNEAPPLTEWARDVMRPGPGPLAVIASDSPRAEIWRKVFGADAVPIKSTTPRASILPGLGLRLVYDVDVSRLADQAIRRAAEHIAAKFGVPLIEAEAGVRGEHGIPLLADDVSYRSERSDDSYVFTFSMPAPQPPEGYVVRPQRSAPQTTCQIARHIIAIADGRAWCTRCAETNESKLVADGFTVPPDELAKVDMTAVPEALARIVAEASGLVIVGRVSDSMCSGQIVTHMSDGEDEDDEGDDCEVCGPGIACWCPEDDDDAEDE